MARVHVRDFLSRFVQPLVAGGELHIAAPIPLSDSERWEFELDDASVELTAVDDARTAVLSTLVCRPPAFVLENVKPEDTEGVKAMNTPPDEVQFMTDLELQARDALVKAIGEKAAHLPEKVLQQARQRSQQQDVDGAAAEYIVFLNSTPDNGSPPDRSRTRAWTGRRADSPSTPTSRPPGRCASRSRPRSA